MKNENILKIIKKYPYGFTTQIKIQYPKLYDCIEKQYIGKNYAEKIYQYFYGENISYCKCGARKSFRSINQGYKNKCKNCYCDVERTLKSKQTNLERYGDENYNNQKQYKQTMLKKYGVEHNFAKGILREKAEKTMFKKYGVKHNWESKSPVRPKWNDKTKEKMRNTLAKTNLERYGVEFPAFHRTNIWKEYKFLSGKTIKVQGYEPFALDILLKNYDESEIITKKSDMPKIYYYYDNKKRRFYPDIFIPKENKFIDAKSDFTYKIQEEKNVKKLTQTKNQGYKVEFWILDEKGKLIKRIKTG